jgi:hypothetical protein
LEIEDIKKKKGGRDFEIHAADCNVGEEGKLKTWGWNTAGMRKVNTYISLRWEPVTKRTALMPKINWEGECSKKEVVRVTAGFNCLWLLLLLAVRALLVLLPR